MPDAARQPASPTPAQPPATAPPDRPRSRRRVTWWLAGAAALTGTLTATVPVLRHYEIPPFSEKGNPLSYDQPLSKAPVGAGRFGVRHLSADAGTVLPTGPRASFRVAHRLDDGTYIGVATLHGPKSGFTGKIWVWAPKEYQEQRYARSGFPVLVALPGGPGYPYNYWMDPGLHLEQSIARWYHEGKSKPFLLAMPVLNPAPDTGGLYWDASDIPGQPKMGTWLTQDVPDFMKANFRTLASRDGWAYMGSSSGGFAALKAVLQYPGRFKAAIASGPDIVPDSPLWKGHAKQENANNPETLARQLTAHGGPDVYIAFQVGSRENPATMRHVKNFIAADGKGPIHTTLNIIQGGRHDAYSYVPAMADGPIEWISRQLQGPTPSP